ncbi:MAG: tetratricopeptide repeat protein [Synechococcales cyanobacterium C42_A2020_086]|jgi:putative thioredoxin|nr:tetratricopeptide repeat protein [Synechococcales cyanobacterium C42_A2020_086]
MGTSVEVNSANFTAAVVEPSYQKPVLVDFFAQWCGPCQLLKPMLEKLAQEYDFVLAKVDIDQNPDLANAYQVEGVPDVRVVMEGKLYPGFVGVLPEPQLREFLGKLNLKSEVSTGIAEAEAALAAGQPAEAEARFAQLLQQYPDNRAVALAAARFWIGQDQLGKAEQLLAPIHQGEREYFAQADALRTLIQLKLDRTKPFTHDLDEPFFAAVQHTLDGNYAAALEGLLTILAKDRKYRQDGARKAMLMIFGLLGDDHPLTREYRRKLTSTLY